MSKTVPAKALDNEGMTATPIGGAAVIPARRGFAVLRPVMLKSSGPPSLNSSDPPSLNPSDYCDTLVVAWRLRGNLAIPITPDHQVNALVAAAVNGQVNDFIALLLPDNTVMTFGEMPQYFRNQDKWLCYAIKTDMARFTQLHRARRKA